MNSLKIYLTKVSTNSNFSMYRTFKKNQLYKLQGQHNCQLLSNLYIFDDRPIRFANKIKPNKHCII